MCLLMAGILWRISIRRSCSWRSAPKICFSGVPICARLESVLAKTSLETHSICGRAWQNFVIPDAKMVSIFCNFA